MEVEDVESLVPLQKRRNRRMYAIAGLIAVVTTTVTVAAVLSPGPRPPEEDFFLPCVGHGEWARVERTNCMPWSEGRRSSMGTFTPYGCWFFRSEESVAMVNVGRTYCHVGDRNSVWATLEKMLTPEKSAVDIFFDWDGVDSGWCHHAVALGFDSLQVPRSLFGKTELVVCVGGCATEDVNEGCVPVDVKDARTNASCECDLTAVNLNCGPDTAKYDCAGLFG